MQVELPTYSVVEAGGAQLRTFRCTVHAVTLSDRGCAQRWVKSQGGERAKGGFGGTATADQADAMWDAKASLDACASCPLGAVHAGCTPVRRSVHYGSMICPRCRRGCTRMIGGARCVSCYNREAEVAKGLNARGNALQRWRTLSAVAVRLVVDNTPRTVEVAAVDAEEVVFHALRSTRGELAFAPVRRNFAAQLELFG